MKVLKIGADWCSGCLVMKPRWAEIEKEHPWLKTEYFDFDDNKAVVNKYRLEQGRLPTFIFLDKKDKEILRLNGEIEKKELVKVISQNKNL